MQETKPEQQPKLTTRERLSKGVTITPHILGIVVAVLLLGASFFAGMQYQKGKRVNVAQTQTSATRQFGSQFSGGDSGFGGGFGRADRAIGTVNAISSTSITIATRTGSTATYTITSSTTVTNDGQSASVSDIQTGDTVFLTLSSSNSSDVASIALNPSFGGQSNSSTNSGSGTSTSTLGA